MFAFKKSAMFIIILVCFVLIYSAYNSFASYERRKKDISYVTDVFSADKALSIDIPKDWSDTIESAYKAFNSSDKLLGYTVFAKTRGYNGYIYVKTSIGPNFSKILSVSVDSKKETTNLGQKVGETDFTDRLKFKEPPLVLNGSEKIIVSLSENTILKDGVYKAENLNYIDGFKNYVEITVQNGKISKANWDAINKEGNSKKEMSENGEYIMTENAPLWHEQAKLMEELLVKMGDPLSISLSNDGKTDSVASASITVNEFVKLSEECLIEAKGAKTMENTIESKASSIDGISGATVSSKAVINSINTSFDFIKKHADSF
ncbi:MAG: FMN-binding protein [Lachnospiraceae bacterium]|nr:FMN-binding protein [Lachnospiraceae bacterium]